MKSITISLICTILLSAVSIANEPSNEHRLYKDAGKSIQRVLDEQDRQELIKDPLALDAKDVIYIENHLVEKEITYTTSDDFLLLIPTFE
jgi:hypothetical protein